MKDNLKYGVYWKEMCWGEMKFPQIIFFYAIYCQLLFYQKEFAET